MTDRDLLSELQLILIEPPDGGDTWPSLIWTRSEVLDAVNGAVRALARDVHLDVARVEIPIAALSTTIALPPDWLATAALVWRSSTNVRTPLGPADSFEGDLALPGWETTSGLPLGYADLDQATLTLRLVPTPALSGTLELLYIRVPPDVSGGAADLAVRLPHSPATIFLRDGAFLVPTASWTVALWVRAHTSTPSGGGARTYYNIGDVGWLYLGSDTDSNTVMLEVSADGVAYVDLGRTSLPLGAWAYLTLTYDAPTHRLTFAINQAVVGAWVYDLATFDLGGQQESAGGWGDHDTAQVRVWQAALTPAELALEAQSDVAVRQANLLADTPLADPAALVDLSGQGRAWTVSLGALVSTAGPRPVAVATLLPLPEEFSSGVKYAALGWLLRKVGRLLDPERADYCERRYELTHTAAEIILEGWS